MPRSGAKGGRAGAKDVRLGASLRPAATLAEFATDPVGRWIGGACFFYCWPSPELCWTVFWGQPSADDMAALGRLFRLELEAPAAPHASIIDARRIESVDAAGFATLTRYVESTRESMRSMVTRLAIVRPDGFVGALAAGFYETIEPPYPVELFGDVTAALEWVGEGPEIGVAIDRLVDGASDVPELLRDLGRALEARLPEVSIESAAKDLGLTVRTLQRRLKQLDTTFRSQVVATQVARAKWWLERSDEPVSRIAYEVGCSTPQHLSTLFRRATGQSPTAWRAARGAS